MFLMFVLSTLLLNQAAQAELYVYPGKGQNPKQMEKDKSECYGWAIQKVGYDPARVQYSAPQPTSSSRKSSVGKGILGGALGGAVIGEIAGNDAGTGAAIGAVAGGLFGGMRRQRQDEEERMRRQQYNEQQYYQQQQMQANFDRAYGVCLEARGYTVK